MVTTSLPYSHRVVYKWETDEDLGDDTSEFLEEDAPDATYSPPEKTRIEMWERMFGANVSRETTLATQPDHHGVAEIAPETLPELNLQFILQVNQSSQPSLQDRVAHSRSGRHTWLNFVNPNWTLEIYSQVAQYAIGIDGESPPPSAIRMAVHFAEQAIGGSYKTEIDFDDDDGSLLFDLRLHNDLLLMAELYLTGILYVGIHDDRGEGYSKLVYWLENPSEKEVTEIFREAK